jgi:hypothetical protein
MTRRTMIANSTEKVVSTTLQFFERPEDAVVSCAGYSSAGFGRNVRPQLPRLGWKRETGQNTRSLPPEIGSGA